MDLPRGVCVLVSTSVDHPEAPPLSGAVRGVVLASRYLIEPSGPASSHLTHISRVDMRSALLSIRNANNKNVVFLYLNDYHAKTCKSPIIQIKN